MSDTPSRAEIMFGDSAPKPTTPTKDATRAEVMFGKAPPAAAPRPENATEKLGRLMYGPAKDQAKADPAATRADKMFGPGIVKAENNPADAGEKPGEQPKAEGEKKADPVAVEQLVQDLGLDAADPMAGDFATAASELGLDKDGAQRLVNLELRNREAYWDKQTTTWMDDLKKSGDVAEMGRRARAVVSRYGDNGFAKEIGVYGNHPGLIRMLDRIALELDL